MRRSIINIWAVGLGLCAVGCGAPAGSNAPPSAPGGPGQPTQIGDPTTIRNDGQAAQPKHGALFEAAGSCKRKQPGVGARRLAPVRTSSSVAMAAVGEGAKLRVVAYVADGDEPLLHTIDVEQGRELGVTTLRGAPEQVLVLADGRVAVTLRQASEVQVLEPAAAPESALSELCSVSVPTEPIALAESPDGARVALSSGWAHALTTFDAATFAAQAQHDLPREPRSVSFSDDGKRAFVAHVVNATLSVVDIEDQGKPRKIDLRMRQATPGSGQGKERLGCQGFALVSAVELPHDPSAVPPPVGEKPPISVTPKPPAPTGPKPGPAPRATPAGRLFAPFVTVDPGEPTRATSGYGDSNAGLPVEFSSVSVIDAEAERLFSRTVAGVVANGAAKPLPGAPRSTGGDCILPRAAAYHDGTLLVACQGNDTLVELDARSVDPARAERRRFRSAAGPTGVAVDSIHGVAAVYGQFEHKLSLISLARGTSREISLQRPARRALTAEQERGRQLFHTAHDERISSDGRACASCHPDGREDALTWSTPEGPRQTAMLMGRLQDSAPFGWSGASKSVDEHLDHTFQRLAGTGLDEAERKALVAYIGAMQRPREGRPTTWATERQKLIARGKELFASSETACASCHPDGSTDGQSHRVAHKATADRIDRFDTPSLRFIGATAPYFHDGRYPSLAAMLEAPDHTMGQSMHLSHPDRVALLAYLESL